MDPTAPRAPALPPETAAPLDAATAYARANALVVEGRFADAVPLYEAALAQRPDHLGALTNLGSALYRCGQIESAIDCYRRVLAQDPNVAQVHTNLAIALERCGSMEEAIRHLRIANRLAPHSTKVLGVLGRCLYESGRLPAAARCFSEALRLDPQSARSANNLAGVYKVLERRDDALALHQRAAALDPQFFEAHENIGKWYEECGDVEQAAAAYGHALGVRDDPLLRLHRALLCPPWFADAAAIDAYRAQVATLLDAWRGRRLTIELARVQSSRAEPPFDWTYHGRDNLPLKRAYAALFAGPFPSAAPTPRSERRRIRVGFVVTPGHEGVFARCMAGVVSRLDGKRFEPLLICSRPGLAALRSAIPDDRAGRVEMSLRFDQVVQRIAAAQCDILYHWEVGTDATNYFLPFCRLAPVQCSGWGWPDTSGAPQLDAHLTSAALAPPGAEALYSEALVRLPHLPPFFLRPPTPPRAAARTQLALDDSAHAYVCAQNLRKVHPDFDAVLAAILRADPRGVLLFVEDAHPIYGEGLRQRWAHRIGDVAARIRFLPRLSPPHYFRLIAAADVLLDTPHFGGANTAYDGFAAGIPAVTMPGVFPRSRYTSALYAALGMDDGIATSPEDYAQRAVRFASEPDVHAATSARLRERAPILFENAAAVVQLEDYFESALASALEN